MHTATAYLETLNPEQRRAVEHGAAEGLAAALLLVIAGAGRRRLLRRQSVPRVEPSLFLCLQLRFVFRDKRTNFGRHIEQL